MHPTSDFEADGEYRQDDRNKDEFRHGFDSSHRNRPLTVAEKTDCLDFLPLSRLIASSR